MNAEQHAKDLLDRGYVDVQEFDNLRIGQRVRHVGQQYSAARLNGTAVIEWIFKSPRIIHGRPDVEVIAKRDKPIWGPDDTHGYWADYHTVPTQVTPDEADSNGGAS